MGDYVESVALAIYISPMLDMTVTIIRCSVQTAKAATLLCLQAALNFTWTGFVVVAAPLTLLALLWLIGYQRFAAPRSHGISSSDQLQKGAAGKMVEIQPRAPAGPVSPCTGVFMSSHVHCTPASHVPCTPASHAATGPTHPSGAYQC